MVCKNLISFFKIFSCQLICFFQLLTGVRASDLNPDWYALGPGISGSVFEIILVDNNVYVGGSFLDAGGNPDADYIARWDGCHWHAVGPGINAEVYAIAVAGNEVYVGGAFSSPFPFITKWNGTEWVSIGTDIDNTVHSIIVDGSSVYAGGGVWNSGFVSKWNGTGWQSLAHNLNGQVHDMVMHETGLYVGGRFTDGGGNVNADGIMLWSDFAWQNLGSGIQSDVFVGVWDLMFYENELLAGGVFINAGGNASADYVAVWNGQQWNALGNGPPGFLGLHALSVFDSSLYVTVGGGWASTDGVYKWNPDMQTWDLFQLMELGADDPLTIMVSDTDNLFVGGFSGMVINNEPYFGLGRWGPPSQVVVLNTHDSGPGSLRDLVECVSENATITFDLDYPAEIILTSGEIHINKNLTISGPGMETLSISGNSLSRIFQLAELHQLNISDVTLKNATSINEGGAIYAKGNLTLKNLRFQNNFQNGMIIILIQKSLSLSPGIQCKIMDTVELKF